MDDMELDDMEIAYQIQLEEAIAASLAFDQPIPSNSSFQPQPKIKRLYGEGFSSSSSSSSNYPKIKVDDTEIYNVYFTGLLCKERVRSPSCSSYKTVTLAAIAVAVCDSMDELIFETSKPLDLFNGDPMSMQIVEWQALIEALDAATALNIKSIVFYCDCYRLYQHVSGLWRPKQHKIEYFLDEVNLLRKGFTSCEPSLIATKDVKFVCKLVREAIKSQRKLLSSQEMLENCVICLNDKSIGEFFLIKGCTHRYCYSCMKQHVEVKLLDGVLPKCPNEDCGNELRVGSCEEFLTPKFIEMMRQQLKEALIPVTEKIYCPYPQCSTLMSRTELRKLPKLPNGFGVARTCYTCHGSFCFNCMAPWHEDMTCKEYKRRNPTLIVDQSTLKNLAAKNLWRQCIKCKHMIELNTGCYHITCRCGYEFCYKCEAKWTTCNCPIWAVENIMYNRDDDNSDSDFEDDEFR